jgi:hypothetical protein
LFSLAAKVDLVVSMNNHVAGAVEDKLRKELEGRTGETDSEDKEKDEEILVHDAFPISLL